jgi:transcriptional regulator with XRE-family HTH domain
MRLTPSQLRAARGLLDWTQEVLAEQAGIAHDSIKKFENGHTKKLQERSEAALRETFEKAGLEFLDNCGVRFRPDGLQVLNGRDGLIQFLDGVYEYLRASGGRVLVTGVEDHVWTGVLQDYAVFHKDRMADLVRGRADIHIRTIVHEDEDNLECTAYSEYRGLPHMSFASVPFYIYGDNLGIMTFHVDQAPKIILIHSAAIAAAYARQFEELWKSAKPIAAELVQETSM